MDSGGIILGRGRLGGMEGTREEREICFAPLFYQLSERTEREPLEVAHRSTSRLEYVASQTDSIQERLNLFWVTNSKARDKIRALTVA